MSSFIPEFSGKRGKRTRGPRNQRRRWTRGRRAESGTKTWTSIAEAYRWSLADPRFVHDTTYFEARARWAFYSGTARKAFTAKSLAPVLPARRGGALFHNFAISARLSPLKERNLELGTRSDSRMDP